MPSSMFESKLPIYANDTRHQSLMSRIFSPLAVRTFLIFLAVVSVWLAFGRAYFYRDPGSIFYDEERAFIRWYSAQREQQANAFMQEISERSKSGDDNFPKARDNATMCAVFITETHKSVKHYLETSMGSLLEGLTDLEREDINLQVFFANSNPSRHPLWYKRWLPRLVDRVYTYADLYSFEAMADVLALENAQNSIAKGPLDYALALQQCHDHTNANYITVLEDDIIAANSWFARTILGAREVQRQTEEAGRPGKWVFLRIFNQERSTGWMSHEVGGNHEVPISFFIASILYAALILLRRRIRLWFNIHLDTWTLAVICCVAVPTFVVLFYQSGKASLLPPSPGVREEQFGCCTQALVFNRQHVPNLIEFIHTWATKGDHGTLINDHSRQAGLGSYSNYPMMVQNIGPLSTTRSIKRDDSKVWSMAFETLSISKLEKDHIKFVRQLYGDRIS